MRRTIANSWAAALTLLLLVIWTPGRAVAQDEDDAGKQADTTQGQSEENEDQAEGSKPAAAIDELLQADEDILAGEGYTYDPQGRRDPFVSPLRRTELEKRPEERPPGIPGLLIDEIDLRGIFLLDGNYVAQIQTTDKRKSYLLRPGDHLYDGEVVGIDRNEVIFKQMVNNPERIKPFREVVKKLMPEP